MHAHTLNASHARLKRWHAEDMVRSALSLIILESRILSYTTDTFYVHKTLKTYFVDSRAKTNRLL